MLLSIYIVHAADYQLKVNLATFFEKRCYTMPKVKSVLNRKLDALK